MGVDVVMVRRRCSRGNGGRNSRVMCSGLWSWRDGLQAKKRKTLETSFLQSQRKGLSAPQAWRKDVALLTNSIMLMSRTSRGCVCPRATQSEQEDTACTTYI